MSKRLPLLLSKDQNGNLIPKFLDAFELVRMKMGGEPKYYGHLHPDSHFCIIKHETAGEGAEMDEHLTFYAGDGVSETLSAAWENVTTLEYAEYDEVY